MSNKNENTDSNNLIPPTIKNAEPINQKMDIGLDISKSIISKLGEPNSTKESVKKNNNKSYIYDYITKFDIVDVPVSNLQKLQEKEIINVPFFQQLRKRINPQMIKSKLMKGLGIRESYTGFHEFMKGDRADLPNVGICNIAKTVGYDVMILPIPENITKLEMDRLNVYRESFLQAVEEKIQELNIPVTRTRLKDKEKPKEVNTQFIQNLAKTEEDILAELKENNNNISNSEIGIDDVYDDNGGELQFEPKPFVKKSQKEEKVNELDIGVIDFDNLDENLTLDQSMLFDPNSVNFEEFTFEDNFQEDEELFETPLNIVKENVSKIDMSGYSDSLENLRKIENEFEFEEE